MLCAGANRRKYLGLCGKTDAYGAEIQKKHLTSEGKNSIIMAVTFCNRLLFSLLLHIVILLQNTYGGFHVNSEKRNIMKALAPRVKNITTNFRALLFSLAAMIKRNWKGHLATLTVLCIVIAAIISTNSLVAYAVSVNGEVIGTARSIDEASEIVDNVQRQATEILGYDVTEVNEISITTELAVSTTAEEENLEELILDNLNGIVKLYAIMVDGAVVGASDEMTDFDGMLSEILDRYSTENTQSISFKEEITVFETFVSNETTLDLDVVAELLDPANTDSEYSLTVISVENYEETSVIPFETEYVDDANLYIGKEEVTQEGCDGESATQFQARCVNGEPVIVTELETYVKTEAVAQVIAVGTSSTPKSTGSYIWPTIGNLTSDFGYRSVTVGSSNHKGIDICGDYGQDIVAADGGVVIYSGTMSGFGYLVQIEHSNGEVTYYAHCSELLVDVGDCVEQGDVIALMGRTGTASAVHLHFEVRVGGVPVDPLECLP